jgi:hypothetical protein
VNQLKINGLGLKGLKHELSILLASHKQQLAHSNTEPSLKAQVCGLTLVHMTRHAIFSLSDFLLLGFSYKNLFLS